MRLNVFALPAIMAFLFSFNNMVADLPWVGGIFAHKRIEMAAQESPKSEPINEERVVKISNKQSIAKLLTAQGVDADSAADAADALADVYNTRRIKAGTEIRLQLEHDADATRLLKLTFSPDPKQRIELTQDSEENYQAQRIARETQRRMVAIRGTVNGSFAASVRRAGVPRTVANQMTRTLAYDVDFQRDVNKGDQFAVMFPAEYDDAGEMIKAGDVQYVQLNGSEEKLSLYRYNNNMYHVDGRNVKRGLLKTPVDGARISSGFGMRFHPILGYSAMHRGTDFAAHVGTPVYAAGDGVIEKASWFSSYGNYVKIKHNSTYETAYAHLSRYGKGIRPGVRVSQGQIIGYVGTTGRSTGPHLHFEVHKGGEQVNPTKVASLGNDRLDGRELKQFAGIVKQYENNFAQLMAKAQPRLAQNTVNMIPASATAVR